MKKKIKSHVQKITATFATRRKLVVIALVILVVGFFGIRQFASKEEQSQFITSQVERTTLVNAIQASGSIIAAGQQSVTTKATGVVKNVFVKDGESVKKGDKLAEIELDQEGAMQNASAYSSYISAVNSLKFANNSYRSSQASLAVVYDEIKGNDASETFEMKEIRTKAEVANDNAYNSIKTAEAKLSSAWLDYNFGTPIITAPISGEIGDLMVAPGMVITASGEGSGSHKLFSIVTGQEVLVSVSVSEVDISQIETGQKVIIVVDAIADKTFTGKVVGLDRTGSVNQGVVSYSALIALDTSDKELLPNMSITAEIILSSKPNVLTVPTGAISQFQGNAVVSVLADGQPQEKQVETGLQTPTQVEIISGLEEGDVVITGERQTGGEGGSQFGGQSGSGFGGGALRPGGFGGGFRGGSSGGSDQH